MYKSHYPKIIASFPLAFNKSPLLKLVNLLVSYQTQNLTITSTGAETAVIRGRFQRLPNFAKCHKKTLASIEGCPLPGRQSEMDPSPAAFKQRKSTKHFSFGSMKSYLEFMILGTQSKKKHNNLNIQSTTGSNIQLSSKMAPRAL